MLFVSDIVSIASHLIRPYGAVSDETIVILYESTAGNTALVIVKSHGSVVTSL